MTQSVSFTVYGTPAPAGSKKVFALKKDGEYTGRVGVEHDSKKARPWMKSVAQEAGRIMHGRQLLHGALMLEVTFYLKRPKGHYRTNGALKPNAPRYPAVKPDLTKLLRGTEDALRGIVWRDDAQVCVQANGKEYGTPERVEITVQALCDVPDVCAQNAGIQLSALV